MRTSSYSVARNDRWVDWMLYGMIIVTVLGTIAAIILAIVFGTSDGSGGGGYVPVVVTNPYGVYTGPVYSGYGSNFNGGYSGSYSSGSVSRVAPVAPPEEEEDPVSVSEDDG